MSLEVKTEEGEKIIICTVPNDLKSIGFQATETFSVDGRFGKGLFSHYRGNGFSIWLNNYDISKKVTITARADFSILELNIPLLNQIEGTWDGVAQPSLAPYQFNLSFTPHVLTKAMFLEGKKYRSLDIHFDKTFLHELSNDFGILAEFLSKVEKGIATDLTKQLFFCDHNMTDVIQFILNRPFNDRSQKFLLEYKVKELLISALEHISNQSSEKKFIVQPRDIEAFQLAKSLIEENYDDPIPLRKLCQKTGLNEFKLKRGFKALYGTTMSDYYVSLKIKEAKRLLLETNLPITQIAYKVGYTYPSNFSLEFVKQTRLTPKDYRKLGKK